MEFLKEHLGDELYGQVAEKLKDSKLKLADLSTGAYVGADKFNTQGEQLKTANDNLKAANAQIAEFGKLDVDGLKKTADDYRAKFEQAEKDAAAKIADMEYTATLKDALSGEKFSSAYARDGVMAEIRAKGLPIEGGKITGLGDALKAIRESTPDAFVQEAPPQKPGQFLPPHTPGNHLSALSAEDFKKLSYGDRLKMKTENPTLYNQYVKG